MNLPESSATLQLAGILAIATDAIISLDADQRIAIFNQGAEQIFGYSSAELLEQPIDILLPERLRVAHRHRIDEFASAPVTSRRMAERSLIVGRRKSGEEFPAEASISRLEITGRTQFTVILRDISERARQQQALQHSEERLRLAVQAGQIGLFERDYQTGECYWSDSFRQNLGVTADEPASFAGYLAHVHAEDRPSVSAEIEQPVPIGSSGSFEIEHRVIRSDGALRWVVLSGQTYFDPSASRRHPRRTIGVLRDITHRKASEQMLAQANQELELRVQERTRSLQKELVRRDQMQAALVKAQRLEAIGQLTGGVAHDFNNLLTVISGNQELLDPYLSDPRARTLLGRAQDASNMAARLVSRLLTFASRQHFEPTSINLNDQIESMADLLQRTLGEPITLKTSLAERLWSIRADPSEIENAILNLTINARDAMPAGGRLFFQTENTQIDPGMARTETGHLPGDFVRLSVTDTGVGMAPDVLARAFEPFFTTKETGRGTGLGLSTIYGFVRQSGGFAQIYSEVGEGTTVNLYWPRSAVDAEAPEATVRDEIRFSEQGETVLVVEDNEAVREATLQRIEGLGYVAVAAAHGAAAINWLASGQTVDLVFSDVVMAGGVSGFDLARWLKDHRPQVKLLLTSGFAAEALKENNSSAGDWPLLRKPYNRLQLSLALHQALKS